MKFRIDVFSWIPQADVPNPLHSLPGGAKQWGPGACGPHFGGDNFLTPAISHSMWLETFRAKQSFSFDMTGFGSQPIVRLNTGVMPGLTTVLTAPRSKGGRVCHSLTATVKTSSASVTWNANEEWYEVKMHGEAQDPIPSAMGELVGGSSGASAASAMTPNLEWDMLIRFQRGSEMPMLTRAAYAMHSPLSLDVAAHKFPMPRNFGNTGNIVHGTIFVRRFPSYVVYVTIEGESGRPVTIPHYFSEASGRNIAEIVVGQTDSLRQLTF